MLDYKIVKKEQFTLVGISRAFQPDTSYREIPQFWAEHMTSGNSDISGRFGLCMENGGGTFDYMIADSYLPWEEIPAGCATRVLPAGTWAVFPCPGPLPQALQQVNSRIWSEWLPGCKAYQLAGKYNLEFYPPCCDAHPEGYSEIWIPVKETK